MPNKDRVLGLPGEGKGIDLRGLSVIYKVWPEDTGGAVAVVEHPIDPERLVRAHVHTREDEISGVVEGTIGVRVGEKEFTATPGCWIFKPRGVPHAFWNPGPRPARLIEIITPGAFAHYFEELSAILHESVPPDVKKLGELDRKWGHRLDMGMIAELQAKLGLKLVGD